MVTDWKEVELLSLSDGGMQNGVFYEVSRKGSGIPLINVGDMYTKVPITSEKLELFDATDDEIKRFAVNDGDLFFTRSSVVPSGIAFCNWYKKTSNKPVVFDSHVIRFKTDKNQVVPMFLYLQCISPKARIFFIANAKTATMTTIDQTIMGKCIIDIPPLPEQHRIAAAISDTDALITALERLIAKKRAIKQGSMQDLLTGKRRLPGFDGEWAEKRIGNIGNTYSGLTGKTKEHFGFGNAQYITFLNVLTNTVIDTTILEKVIVGEMENQNAVRSGDLFFNTSSETPEEVGMCAVLTKECPNTFLNSFCFGFRLVDEEISGLFLSYYFNSNCGRTIMSLLAQGATRYNLSKSYFNDTVLLLPAKPEQTAIAEILSDMDAEIDKLTAKLKKLQHIKQGMMSELLTGRIRLVEQDATTNTENLDAVAGR